MPKAVLMLCVAHRTPATAAAIQGLVDAGADLVEIDVRVSAGRLVASHFLPLLPIPWLTGKALLERDNLHIRRFRTQSPGPALHDIIARVPTGTAILLDPKDKDPARRAELLRLLQRLPQRSRFCVSTRYLDDLAALRSAGFQTWRTLDNRADLSQLLRGTDFADAGVSIRHRLVEASTIGALKQLSPMVVAWTVNDLPTAARLKQLGVTGITTDRADVMRFLRG